jgi:hypothetical protein
MTYYFLVILGYPIVPLKKEGDEMNEQVIRDFSASKMSVPKPLLVFFV